MLWILGVISWLMRLYLIGLNDTSSEDHHKRALYPNACKNSSKREVESIGFLTWEESEKGIENNSFERQKGTREFFYGSQAKHCETMETADCTGQIPMEQVITSM